MNRRTLLTALGAGVAVSSLPFAFAGEAAALPAPAPADLSGVREALAPAAAPEEMQWRRRGWRRRGWRRRGWGGRPWRRRRCWINRRGFRVCRW